MDVVTDRMQVVEKLTTFAPDMSAGKIVIQSNEDDNFVQAIEELGSAEARHMAIAFAASKGCPDPRINGSLEGPYAVNEDGQAMDEIHDSEGNSLPPQHPKMQPVAYRVAVPVCRKLV